MSDWPENHVKKSGWTKDACDDWEEVNGKGSAPGAVISGQFARLRKAGAPWGEVREAWRRYLRLETPKFHSPGAFASALALLARPAADRHDEEGRRFSGGYP